MQFPGHGLCLPNACNQILCHPTERDGHSKTNTVSQKSNRMDFYMLDMWIMRNVRWNRIRLKNLGKKMTKVFKKYTCVISPTMGVTCPLSGKQNQALTSSSLYNLVKIRSTTTELCSIQTHTHKCRHNENSGRWKLCLRTINSSSQSSCITIYWTDLLSILAYRCLFILKQFFVIFFRNWTGVLVLNRWLVRIYKTRHDWLIRTYKTGHDWQVRTCGWSHDWRTGGLD